MLAAFALAAVALAAGACQNNTTSPTTPTSTYAPYSQTDLVVGTGAAAANGNLVTVNYTGWLYDGTKPDNKGPIFDTTTGASSLSFTLGSAYAITGFEQGLVGMKVGGIRRLVIPPSLAYGGDRVAAIPPYSTLVFEVDLVDVQ
jgi:FKBP-type peptidyl-prolyl cis-trans isomerase FkpA